ncbi:aminotransferase-like domain-containing protein [Sabulicella glaciei]|uniref:PLP-dependent aminotransferase family protein n=1 Tax=Sabulicella glaciei TaxID=2984948 RepID=A0ABT3NZD4_9PROT|nr:PLP-dependent aminotransferase family protein [Roseococcus sp. MDT2-1-1]MCW8087527.1 PLP-dependent aminotransferase family protein [Roseococcus sp. MDT2-1-1]
MLADRQRQKLVLPEIDAPLPERLAMSVETLVRSGAYRPGDRLPTHRELASVAGVAIGTVTRAIDLLTKRGVLRGEVGRGTFVNFPPESPQVVDLTINGPPSLITEEEMKAAAERAVARSLALPGSGYADLRGTQEQRVILADWLRRTRTDVSEEEMLLCVGAQQALHLSFADLKPHTSTVLTEAATFPGAISAAADLGMRLEAVPHDSEGIVPEALDQALRETSARAIYLTPVCQNPLGFEMGAARRRAVLEVCLRHEAMIVEDDIYGLYAAKGRCTFRELAPEQVYYVTSLSKCLTPLMRLGVLVPPGGRLHALKRRLRAAVWGPAPFAVDLGCAMVEMGLDTRMAAALRTEARRRMTMTARILGLGLDNVPMPDGAPHLWLPMERLEAEALARRAGEQGIRLTPPGATAISAEGSGGLRLCIMAPRESATLEQVLYRLAALRAAPEETIV